MIRWLKRLVYAAVRPLFVSDVGPSVDYECVMCGNPVLARALTCCAGCTVRLNETPWPREVPHERV